MNASRLLSVAFATALGLVGCSIIVQSSVKKGVGVACQRADECQGAGAICLENTCTTPCNVDTECPTGTRCFGQTCGAPLKAGFVYVGVPGDEGWTLTHDQGRKFAQDKLPFLSTVTAENAFLPDVAGAKMEEMIAGGATTIFATSDSLRKVTSDMAAKHPKVQFFLCSGTQSTGNLSGYFARSYQSWYIAGVAAAKKTKTNRLGFVGSFVNPEVVRHINAFTRGAQSVNPAVVVEVNWVGFWFDTAQPKKYTEAPTPFGPDEVIARETRMTDLLIADGCDVIAHAADDGRAVERVEKYFNDASNPARYQKVFSIGNDNDNACARGPNSCLGSVYWNWGPLYQRIIKDVRAGRYKHGVINEPIAKDATNSLNFFGLTTNINVATSDLNIAVGNATSSIVSKSVDPFGGPYNVTFADQRPEGGTIGNGKTIEDAELATLCWFVDGVVTGPKSAAGTNTPARVPDGTIDIGTGEKSSCTANR